MKLDLLTIHNSRLKDGHFLYDTGYRLYLNDKLVAEEEPNMLGAQRDVEDHLQDILEALGYEVTIRDVLLDEDAEDDV